MIRHYDGTPECAQKISAQSKRGAIWAVEWTWAKHRICLTAAEAERVRGIWKRWYERCGWKVVGRRAYGPQKELGKTNAHICNVIKYDPHTRKVLEVR